MLPRSPTCRIRASGAACGAPNGLKWGPVDMPSSELQSPNSWMWNPCGPSLRPWMVAWTWTPPRTAVKVTVPSTLLPLVGCRTAMAWVTRARAMACGAAGAAGAGATWARVATAATATASAPAERAEATFFAGMLSLLRCGWNVVRTTPGAMQLSLPPGRSQGLTPRRAASRNDPVRAKSGPGPGAPSTGTGGSRRRGGGGRGSGRLRAGVGRLEGGDQGGGAQRGQQIGLGLRGRPDRIQPGVLQLDQPLACLHQLGQVRLTRLEQPLQVGYLL